MTIRSNVLLLTIGAALIAAEPSITIHGDVGRQVVAQAADGTFTPCYLRMMTGFEAPSLANITLELVTPPRHGTLNTHGGFLQWLYTPKPGYHGLDALQYRVRDGAGNAALGTLRFACRQPGRREGLRVELLVAQSVYTTAVAKDHIDRLKADIEREGYACVISLWDAPRSSPQQIRRHLARQVCTGPTVLAGVILIGNLPRWRPGDNGLGNGIADDTHYVAPLGKTATEQLFWMSSYDTNDAGELRQALDASHWQHTGQARLPNRMYLRSGTWGDSTGEFQRQTIASLQRVWPHFTIAPSFNWVGSAQQLGYQYLERDGHNAPGTINGPYMNAVSFISGCSAWGNVQDYLFTRGGLNALCHADAVATSGAYVLTYFSHPNDRSGYEMIDRLAHGESFGDALLLGLSGGMNSTKRYGGDLTIRAHSGPSNSLPRVTNLRASATQVVTGQEVVFTAAISDPDAGTSDNPQLDFESQVEWFMGGYGKYSRAAATYTQTSPTVPWTVTQRHAFAKPGTYVVRVEAMDEWRTRAWHEITITVTPGTEPTNTAPTVDAGPARTVVLSSGSAVAQLDGTVGDDGLPNGALTTAWAKISGPGSVAFAAASAIDTAATFTAAGTYVLALTVNDGALSAQDSVTITVNLAPVVGLPAPWTTTAIGNAGGSAAHNAGTFTVVASGHDIWGVSDAFRFVHQPLTGDGALSARVDVLTADNAWAKAGVMLRDGTLPGARHAMTVVTPQRGLAFQRRLVAQGSSAHSAGSRSAAPRWVRIRRQGETLYGAESADGTTWTRIGSATIALPATVQAGLCVTAHDDARTGTAVFSQVTLTPTGGG